MDQETAKTLFENGALILLSDIPLGTEVGIDEHSWNVGPKFKGFKMIPPGPHYLFYSTSQGPRNGVFLFLQPRQILLKKWDPSTEEIIDDKREFYADIRELDPFLGPYPYESYRRWQKLTSHISEKVVDKVLQNRNLNTMMSGSQNDLPVFSSDYLKDETFDLGVDSKGKGPKTTNEARCTEKNKDENTRIIFTSIDLRRSIPQNPSNEELAKYGMDKSHLLRSLINNEFSSYNNLLGELQLAYLALLTAFNYDGFEQWKKIVALICYSEEAINQIPDLFENFISILRVQLEGKKDDFMVDLFSSENFLNESLMFFKETIDDTNLPELKKKWLKLEKHLKTQFGWSFVEENCI